MRKLVYTVQIWREGGMFTSYCPELDLASCGKTPEQARGNLEEVVSIFVEETSRQGTLAELLEEAGYDLDECADVVVRHRAVTQDLATAPVPAL